LAGDRIDVPLELCDFEVLGSELVDGVLEVEVASTFPRACFHCGSMAVEGHGIQRRRVRDRAQGHPTVLVWAQRRLRCLDCGRTSRERHPAVAGRCRITHRFRRRLFERACERPFSDVAGDEAVTHWRVVEAFDHHAATELAGTSAAPRVLAIDESAFRRRHRYHTVVSDPEARIVFDLVEGRSARSCGAALAGLSPQVRAGIETVTIDCYWPYRKAIEAMLPHARIVADKFHVLRVVNESAQRVRRRFGRKPRTERVGRDGGLARQHNPRNDPRLYRSRWVFMKRDRHLAGDERAALFALFTDQPEVGVAWALKEAFAAIYDAPDRAEAERRLDVWVHHATASGLDEFANTWRTLGWWREQILAYFTDRQTNAFAEGITNKIKVIKRSAYGFRNPRRYRHKVLLACGHRPRSKTSTHRPSR
jgi:transposase